MHKASIWMWKGFMNVSRFYSHCVIHRYAPIRLTVTGKLADTWSWCLERVFCSDFWVVSSADRLLLLCLLVPSLGPVELLLFLFGVPERLKSLPLYSALLSELSNACNTQSARYNNNEYKLIHYDKEYYYEPGWHLKVNLDCELLPLYHCNKEKNM